MCPDVFTVEAKSSNGSCRHLDVLKHLNLTENNELFSMTRPGSAESPTKNEKDQKFVSYVWIDSWWQGDDISWNPDDFCGIQRIYLPTKLWWKPDVTIEEMIEKDKADQSPYLMVNSSGCVILRKNMVVVSTCRMQIDKFPFDIQSCTLTFKSVIYSDEDIELVPSGDISWNLEWSRKMMRTQSEWLFHDLTMDNKTVNNFGFNQSMLVYTIKMQRQSALYVANFLLPIMFFFCLDMASFLISDSSDEKLSFKVTVLLAVTVMQLILNEILPSSSDMIPLIAVYCIGIFSLMMLSLMETILVMHLKEKDSASQDNEGSSNQLTEESCDFEELSDEQREAVKTLTLLFSCRKEEGKPGYWTGVAKTINRVFFILYVIAASLFFAFMFFGWKSDENNTANISGN
ncbi:5-hydroxytryptamine receptor 3A-like isoform X2 [Sebastes umbrosus]|uniref:5-hydroxytryptamine receptor 3A-like isoform X2 n=1 Tax=Sebastes umbrosus TaxID=72105 RepID=UPI00189E5081|nr:5-hydroxytryptamine receptor 3A-like isoform X2 [Sebastes umbrosus]